jgi:hypothetical protein
MENPWVHLCDSYRNGFLLDLLECVLLAIAAMVADWTGEHSSP